MKKVLILAGALLAATTVTASAQWTDNFDSYADQAAFNAVWANSGSPVLLDTDNDPVAPSPPNTVQQGTAAQQSRREIGTGIMLKDIDFTIDFYDAAAGTARAYAMVYGRGGAGGWTDTLTQIVAIGKYNTSTTNKYWGRIAFGSDNWFTLDLGPDRSIGWHTARIVGNGVDTLEFYIDGILGASKTLTPANQTVVMNWVVLGSGLTSAHAMNFDNVSIAVVPEPASLIALGAGLVSMVGLARRRN